MSQADDPGRPIHCGCVSAVVVVVSSTALVWIFLGPARLWIAGLVALLVVGTPMVMTLLEDRWRIITPEQIGRGAPASCPHCGDTLSILAKKRRFVVDCGICGYRVKGRWHVS